MPLFHRADLLASCKRTDRPIYISVDADDMGGTALVEAELIPVFESMLQVPHTTTILLSYQSTDETAFILSWSTYTAIQLIALPYTWIL